MKTALITGGGGFVGKAVVKRLLDEGVSCRVLGRNPYPELHSLGVECVVGDIRDQDAVLEACRGVDIVFHVAALAGIWGTWEGYYSINVEGTKNVIAGCKKNDIPNLVYTSTPSVVFNRSDICGGDESLPYPTSFQCHYAKSKVMAEKIVLEAAGESLRSCALRPHLIWGPGDPHLIPRILDRGRKGQLKIVGEGSNLVDISYIENVAHAHLLAAENLISSGTASGNAYFISQGEPVNLWDWVNSLFEKAGVETLQKKVPFFLAYGAGGVLELFHTLFRSAEEPRMTRFLAEQLAKSHYFSIAKAEKDLGYTPQVSTEEGMDRLLQWILQS